MALINEASLKKIKKDRNNVHKPVEATYTLFEEDGKKYFQLDTYGSEERKIKGKISQSIQLEQDTVKKLLDLLESEFNIK